MFRWYTREDRKLMYDAMSYNEKKGNWKYKWHLEKQVGDTRLFVTETNSDIEKKAARK